MRGRKMGMLFDWSTSHLKGLSFLGASWIYRTQRSGRNPGWENLLVHWHLGGKKAVRVGSISQEFNVDKDGGLKVKPGNSHNWRGRPRYISNDKAKGDAGRVQGLLPFLASVSRPEKSHTQLLYAWKHPLKSSKIPLSGSFILEFLEQSCLKVLCSVVRHHAHIFVRFRVQVFGLENVIHLVFISSLEWSMRYFPVHLFSFKGWWLRHFLSWSQSDKEPSGCCR